jgi:hypothetical protein
VVLEYIKPLDVHPALCFFYSIKFFVILKPANKMNSQQPTFTMTVTEQMPIDQEFYESPTQSVRGSPTSTVPLDETSSSESSSVIVISNDDENGQMTRVTSRSLREVPKRDYTCKVYLETMDAATSIAAPKPNKPKANKPKASKRKIDNTDFGFIVRT